MAKPSLAELRYRITSDINNLLMTHNISNSIHDKLAQALAALTYGLYCYIDNVSSQILPQNANGDYLESWFELFNVNKKLAQKASGNVTVRANIDLTIPQNTIFDSAAGYQYQTLQAYNIIADTDTTLFLESIENGNEYNLLLNSKLTNDTYPDLIVLTAEISGGSEDESLDAQRSRLIKKIQTAGNNGSVSFYESQATTMQGIDRAWVESVLSDEDIVVVYVASNNRLSPQIAGQLLIDTEKKLEYSKPISISKIAVRSVTALPVDIVVRSLEVIDEAEKITITQLISDFIYKNYDINQTVTSRDIQFLLDAYSYSVTVQHQGKSGGIPYLNNINWVQTTNV